jgi:hypothetical protein
MPASRDQADQANRYQAETHWFGVPPQLVLLGLAAVLFVLAVVLFAGGSWAVGLVLLGLSALMTAAFLEVVRRRPESEWLRSAYWWASSHLELVRARVKAIAEVQRLRGSQAVIESERRMALLRLGEAERSRDGVAAEMARERLRELKRAAQALEGREEAGRAVADERIARVRLSVQETLVVEPEPFPPPDDDDRLPAA